jgi:hypothetical protein
MKLYQDFIAQLEDLGFTFPCTSEQFYHRAEFFIFDPMFVASDYIEESEMTPGWQTSLIHDLCNEGGVSIE